MLSLWWKSPFLKRRLCTETGPCSLQDNGVGGVYILSYSLFIQESKGKEEEKAKGKKEQDKNPKKGETTGQ